MARIAPLDPAATTGKPRELLDQVQKTLGATPNLFTTLAVAPAALEGFLGLFGALGKGQLPAKLREQVALAVAEDNRCSYCLSAHSFIGSSLGISEEELSANRGARSSDPKVEASLRFATAVNERRGAVGDAEWAAARAAGLSDAEIVELIAHVALNVFTNYFNRAVDTGVDFPLVPPPRGERELTAA